jgi:hypothetical protein
MAISLRAYRPGCKKIVTALPMLDNSELKPALDSNADIRVMHIARGGDHIWSLTDQEKENLRNTMPSAQPKDGKLGNYQTMWLPESDKTDLFRPSEMGTLS